MVKLQSVHLNAQPNVDDILLEQRSASVKHIEGIVPSVGVIAIKGPDRQGVMDSGCAYQQKMISIYRNS